MSSDSRLPEQYPTEPPIATVFPLRPRSSIEQIASPVDQLTIIGRREGYLIDCFAPAEIIDHEEVPVKEEWALSLAKEMRAKAAANGGTGQVTPVFLGYIPGEPKLKITDGFHRDAALRINGEDSRYATVMETTWDKLYDDRIFLAKDHAHVRFSRVVQWIREVWEFSEVADKLSVEQAVLLYRFDTDGSKLGLNPNDVETAKSWVRRKEEQWQMAAMTIHSHLKIAENVDPRLVHSTREKKDSRVLEAPTQAIIKIFSDVLPGNFEAQNLVMNVAKEHNLTGPQVKALCNLVKDCEDSEVASAALAAINPNSWQPEYADTTKRALRRAYDPRHKGASVLNRVLQDIGNIRERLNQTTTLSEPLDESMRQNLRETRSAAETALRDLTKLVTGLTVAIGDSHKSPRAETPKLPPSNTGRKDSFSIVLSAFFEGRIPNPPPITTPEQAALADALLEWQEFYGNSPNIPVVQHMLGQFRAATSEAV